MRIRRGGRLKKRLWWLPSPRRPEVPTFWLAGLVLCSMRLQYYDVNYAREQLWAIREGLA